MFETEYKFYEENRELLREKYLGKRVVIVKDKILGVYDSDVEAITETKKTMDLGTFCVKYIPVDPEEEYYRLMSFVNSPPRPLRSPCLRVKFFAQINYAK